jgi:hypothetical protein
MSEQGHLLKMVHHQILEHDGDGLMQARAAIATIGSVFMSCSGLVIAEGEELIAADDESAAMMRLLAGVLISEAQADLPPK